MGKRGNDNAQLSKEEYDALEARGGASEDTAGTGDAFNKASTEVLARRRIVRTSGVWKKPKSSTTTTATTAATTTGPVGPSSSSLSSSPAPANPFTNFSFTKTSPAPAAPAPDTKRRKFATAPAANPFAATTLTTNPTTTTATSNSATNTTAADKPSSSALLELHKAFAERFTKSEEGKRTDRKQPYRQYLRTLKSLEGVVPPEATTITATVSTDSSKGSGPFTSTTPAFSLTTTAATTPDSGVESGVALFPPAPAAPVVPFSFDKPAGPGPTFSFGASSSSAQSTPAPASAAFSFALGASKSPTVAAKSVAAATPTNGDTAEEDGEKKEEPAEQLETADTDWKTLNEFNCKVYQHRDEVKVFARGDLKLQRHKTQPGTQRMVMRDGVTGKVQLNVAVSKTMTFKKGKDPRKNKGPTCKIVFFALLEQERGAEMLTIVCREEDLDKLHEELESLAP